VAPLLQFPERIDLWRTRNAFLRLPVPPVGILVSQGEWRASFPSAGLSNLTGYTAAGECGELRGGFCRHCQRGYYSLDILDSELFDRHAENFSVDFIRLSIANETSLPQSRSLRCVVATTLFQLTRGCEVARVGVSPPSPRPHFTCIGAPSGR